MDTQALIEQLTFVRYAEDAEIPPRFDLLERMWVCMDTDQYPIEPSKADGYICLMADDRQVGVWYYKLIDGLFGPKRTYLVDMPQLFRELRETLGAYMAGHFTLGAVRMRAVYVPHLSMTPETPNDAVTLC